MNSQFTESVELDLYTSEYGQDLLRKYQIVELIYRSSNSEIFLIKSLSDDRLYTLKAMFKIDGISFNPESLMHIDYPSIAKIIEYGTSEKYDFIVKPFYQGKHLKTLVEENGPFTESYVVELGEQLLDIFEYLHGFEPPIIYRDLKPENIIMQEDGKLLLIDLVTMRRMSAKQSTDTFHVGTRGFASPEQYGFKQTDERTDIYTLGATLYFLLTGKIPENKVDEIFSESDHISDHMKNLIGKCVSFDPKNRYQNMSRLRKALTKKTIREKYSKKVLGIFVSLAFIAFVIMVWQALLNEKSLPKANDISDNTPIISVDTSQLSQVESNNILDVEAIENSTNSDMVADQVEDIELAATTGDPIDGKTDLQVEHIDAAEGDLEEETDIEANNNGEIVDDPEAGANNELEEVDIATNTEVNQNTPDTIETITVTEANITYDLQNIDDYNDIPLDGVVSISDSLDIRQEFETLYFTVDRDGLEDYQKDFSHITVISLFDDFSESMLKRHIYDAVVLGHGINYYNDFGFGSTAYKGFINYLLLIFDESYYCIGYAFVEDYESIDYGGTDFYGGTSEQPLYDDQVIANGIVITPYEDEMVLHINLSLLPQEQQGVSFVASVGFIGQATEDYFQQIDDNINQYAVPYDVNGNYFAYGGEMNYFDLDYMILLLDENREVLIRYIVKH